MFPCKVAMTIIYLMQIHKTFFFLRIFDPVSYIVTMLYTVMWDLKVFMLFYFILIFLFSQIYSVFGLNNQRISSIDSRPNTFSDFYDYAAAVRAVEATKFKAPGVPGSEYKHIGPFMGSFLTVLRTSMGASSFAAAGFLTEQENILFWIIWFMCVCITNIIFLNFVVAEACSSYQKIKKNLQAEINTAKADLTAEAEGMRSKATKSNTILPKYIIVRHIET